MKKLWILDLEATCFIDEPEPPNFWSEIIEIGAVLFDPRTQNIEKEFQTFVRPVLFPKLSRSCMALTSITQEQVDSAPTLEEALQRMQQHFCPTEVIFASWGNYDRNKLRESCRRFHLSYPFSDEHINLKQAFADHFGVRPMGMDRALKMLGLPLEGTHHRGIDDARNIARIVRAMLQKGWIYPF